MCQSIKRIFLFTAFLVLIALSARVTEAACATVVQSAPHAPDASITDADGDGVYEVNESIEFCGNTGDVLVTYDNYSYDWTNDGTFEDAICKNPDGRCFNHTYSAIGNYTVIIKEGSEEFSIFDQDSYNIQVVADNTPPPFNYSALDPYRHIINECDLQDTSDSLSLIGISLLAVFLAFTVWYLKLPMLEIMIGVFLCFYGFNIASCFQSGVLFYIGLGFGLALDGIRRV